MAVALVSAGSILPLLGWARTFTCAATTGQPSVQATNPRALGVADCAARAFRHLLFFFSLAYFF